MERFCVDCKFYQKEFNIKPSCGRYVTYTISAVNGIIPHYDSCEETREPGGKCGPEGYGWVRPNLLIRLLKKLII